MDLVEGREAGVVPVEHVTVAVGTGKGGAVLCRRQQRSGLHVDERALGERGAEVDADDQLRHSVATTSTAATTRHSTSPREISSGVHDGPSGLPSRMARSAER